MSERRTTNGLAPSSPLRFLSLGCLGGLGLAACSLQDFDRLGQGQASSAGASLTNGGGTGGQSGSGTGGRFGGGTTGGSPEPAGAGTSADAGAEPLGPSTLVNVSFEEGALGWLAEPPEALGVYAFVQWPVTGATTPDGLNQLSTWSESTAFSVRLYQSLEGLDDGRYKLAGHFNFGTGHNAVYLFARGCGGGDLQGDVQQTLPSQWLRAELTGIQVVGGRCEVGFFVDANPNNWLNADLFSFESDP